MHKEKPKPTTYGVMASFATAEDLLAAAQRTKEEGYKRIDAYSPYPIEGLSEAIGFHSTGVPFLSLCGALMGGIGGFLMQYWMVVIDYPLNIGGRPLFSWPAWIPPSYELTILLGSFGAVIGMIVLNGLPMPYHPVFNVPQFRHASVDGFFLVVEARDPKFDAEKTKSFLESLNPRGVFHVEP